MYRDNHTLKCPYCDDLAPYGDERHIWLRAHLDSRIHRVWWVLIRPIFVGLLRVFRFVRHVFRTRDWLTMMILGALALFVATAIFSTIETLIIGLVIYAVATMLDILRRRRNRNW